MLDRLGLDDLGGRDVGAEHHHVRRLAAAFAIRAGAHDIVQQRSELAGAGRIQDAHPAEDHFFGGQRRSIREGQVRS